MADMTPISDEALRELREGLEGVPGGPWSYRPKEFDDWGCVRGPSDANGLSTFVFHVRSGFPSEAELNEHRRLRTDPWEAFARHLARCSPDIILSLLARLDAAEGGWQVKPLEWRPTPEGKWLRAKGGGRTYEVRNDSRAGEKKAAAQADFEACIRSALVGSGQNLADANNKIPTPPATTAGREADLPTEEA